MPWYYADNGKQTGPVTDEQFQSLLSTGAVRGDTLVWRDGMANWLPYSSVATPGDTPIAVAPPLAGSTGVVCAECRQTFPPEQTIRFGDAFVCPNCKPIYVQKLREGALTPGPGEVRYAGFWIRAVAKFIDALIVGIPTMLLYFLMVFGFGMGGAAGLGGNLNAGPGAVMAMMGLQLGIQAIAIALGAAYNIYFVTKRAATPGKMAVGLRIINADGTRIGAGKATGRYFAEMLSGLTCYIGYIIAGFDDQKRSLHDHICSTRVIYK
ncbi:MAG TPA: RDD family protein [Candidatus Acidoferrum sp.]|nr:RDD family protein [Candidatus Acidoferrum sp.]